MMNGLFFTLGLLVGVIVGAVGSIATAYHISKK